MVRIDRERVDAIDVRPLDVPEDVDAARAARQRAQHEIVEVLARADCCAELEDSIDRVRDEAERVPRDRAPEERLAAPHEIGDRGDHERPVDGELGHPFPELCQALLRRNIPVAGEIDEGERREEREHDGARAREALLPLPLAREEREEEQDRRDVVDADLPRDVPVHLLEGRDEERREEEGRRDALERERAGAREGQGGGCHATVLNTSASSSTRLARERRSRHSGESGVPSRFPSFQRRWRSTSAARIASTSSGATTVPAPVSRRRSAAAPSGGTTARIGRSAARYSKIFPVRTPLPRPPESGIRRSSASESRCSSSERRRET